MAVQLCSSEIPSLFPPRDPEIPESTTTDSDFCFRNAFSVPELPSADELFFNGKIRPAGPRQPNSLIHLHCPSVSGEHHNLDVKLEEHKKITRLKEFLLMSDADDDDDPADRSFLQFKRSSSLNCDRTQSKGLIKSSLRFLGRSNSTGCAPDPEKRRLQKQPSVSRKCSGSVGDEFHGYPTRKPPLKNWRSSGVRVSPVLSLPQLFVTNGTVDLFGLSSLFCNGKVKKKKR